ncbi:peptidase [Pollutimonas subterranea]|uniref:Peptidase n=1 Tax=Pollutimonas subterranea TaxID=2045210 RepID=A0A2N4U2X2_9BURK|nr:PepSY-associated TM helix domain-containing protein [Pollutimonas subterranea]PLC49372.1 peptidase [Pollutimonas subterranea]
MQTNTSTEAAAGASARKVAKAPGIRQTMSDLHIWTGLLAGWLLYAMFLTGTASYFRDEISQWMRPDVPAQLQLADAADLAPRLIATMQTLAPTSTQWGIRLPDARNNTASAFWRDDKRFKRATLDPATAQAIGVRESIGGEFFYRFHFQLHYLPVLWGRWLAGLCGMFMLVAIVSGVITHKKIFIDFFTFRGGKGQRSWLDAHNALSVLGLPFHLMITYTGLITLMLMYMPWGSDAAFKEASQRQAMQTELSAFVRPGQPSGQKAALAPVGGMVEQAQARWGRNGVGSVNVNNPGDASARVIVVRADDARVSTSPQFMMFDGATGQLLQTKDRVGAAAETRGVMYALHLGRFSDYPLRWLYFLVSLAGTAMVGTGLVMWTVKRRARLPDPARPYFGFRLVERLNIAAIAGLSVAMAAFFWGNRLLPAAMADRKVWEVDLLFIVWGATLTYALARPAKRAWIELLWLAAALLVLLPLVNGLTTDRNLMHSIATGDWLFAGFDLTLLAFGGLHALLAMRVKRHKAAVRPVARKSRRAPGTAASGASLDLAPSVTATGPL